MLPKKEKPVTPHEFAKIIDVHHTWVYEYIKRGLIKTIKENSRMMIPFSSQHRRFLYFRMISGGSTQVKLDATVVEQVDQMERENQPVAFAPLGAKNDFKEAIQAAPTPVRGKVVKLKEVKKVEDEEESPHDQTVASTIQTVSHMQSVKLRKEEAITKKAELDYEEKMGLLVRKEDVAHLWSDLGMKVQKAILSIPDRLAPILANENDSHKVHRKMTDELKYALRNLSVEMKDELEALERTDEE